MGDKIFNVAVKAIIKKGDEYLILTRSETDIFKPNEFDLPGGKINLDEKLEDALRREVMEESNLEIEIIKPIKAWDVIKPDRHLVGVTYLTNYTSGDVELSYEHSEYHWATLEMILKGDYPDWIKNDFKLI